MTEETIARTPEKQPKQQSEKARTLEILSVFAEHNFYSNGLTPVELRTTLEELGPTFVKIGQIASSRNDLLPDSYCRELAKLRGNVIPLEAEVARRAIEEEIGKPIEEIFSEFNDEPLGSASIAQAHYGVLLDGRKVVTKVQRPGIADTMRRDFAMLNKMAKLVNMATPEDGAEIIDLQSVLRELEQVTEEELDFRIEAENTRAFRASCIADETVVSCPEIIDELSSERVLTMTFVDGYSVGKRDRIVADGYDPEAIAGVLIDSYLHQILDVGVFHGDPHQGNIMLSAGVPYWIDFGMIGRIEQRSIDVIQKIIVALVQKDADDLAEAVLSIGKLSKKIDRAALVEDIDALIMKYFPLTDIDVAAIMSDLMQLCSDYGVSVPGEYTMLIRSLITFMGVLEELSPNADFFGMLSEKMVQRMVAGFSLQEKLSNSVDQLAAGGMKAAKLPGLAVDALGNLLKGRTKFGLELSGLDEPLARIEHLVRYVVLILIACVIFSGSCILCVSNMTPQIYDIPVFAFVGFLFSTALGIYGVKGMMKKRR